MKHIYIVCALVVACITPVFVAADPEPASGSAINFSARAEMGQKPLIYGTAVQGTRLLLLRAVGEGLKAFDVERVVSNPRITVFDATGNPVAASLAMKALSDQEWDLVSSASEAVGAFPLSRSSADAVILIPWSEVGTFHITADATTAGEVLFECYVVPWEQYDRGTFVGLHVVQSEVPPIID